MHATNKHMPQTMIAKLTVHWHDHFVQSKDVESLCPPPHILVTVATLRKLRREKCVEEMNRLFLLIVL
jgi:hypothetical protein